MEYLVLFKSSFTDFLVACFHSSDVKDHVNLLIFKSQRDLKAKENPLKNFLLAVSSSLVFMSLLLEGRMRLAALMDLISLVSTGREYLHRDLQEQYLLHFNFYRDRKMWAPNAPHVNLVTLISKRIKNLMMPQPPLNKHTQSRL